MPWRVLKRSVLMVTSCLFDWSHLPQRTDHELNVIIWSAERGGPCAYSNLYLTPKLAMPLGQIGDRQAPPATRESALVLRTPQASWGYSGFTPVDGPSDDQHTTCTACVRGSTKATRLETGTRTVPESSNLMIYTFHGIHSNL